MRGTFSLLPLQQGGVDGGGGLAGTTASDLSVLVRCDATAGGGYIAVARRILEGNVECLRERENSSQVCTCM